MNEDKEGSRKTNKWLIILVILLFAFLGFYLYNQYSFLFLQPNQGTLDNREATEETAENGETSNSEENEEVNTEGDQQTTNEQEIKDKNQQATTGDKKEEVTNEEEPKASEDSETTDTQTDKLKNDTGEEVEKKQEEQVVKEDQDRKEDGKFNREVDLLIIGQDQKKDVKEGNVQSDSIILANLKPEEKALTITAVPSHKEYKGHKLQTYDREQLMKSMDEITGINPDYYFVIDYEGFKNIVNLIGGLEVTLDDDFEVPDLGLFLKKGNNLLSGQEALNYARYFDSTEEEFTRIKRQQQVMKSFADKIFQKNTLLNIPRLYKTVIQTIKNVNTNFDYDLAIEAYNFISNSNDFDIKYDVLEIKDSRN